MKAGSAWIDDGTALMRNLGLLVFPFVAGYFAWKRRFTGAVAASLLIPFAALAVALNLYPFAAGSSTGILAALHAPVILWMLAGLAYVGRFTNRRMGPIAVIGCPDIDRSGESVTPIGGGVT